MKVWEFVITSWIAASLVAIAALGAAYVSATVNRRKKK